jgi:predicted phosphodiesterase
MRIQVASDLHLELLRVPGERLVLPAPDADVLVLAGDIASGTKAIELFADWPVPVVYVAGNHEFYRQSWEGLRGKLKSASRGTNVHYLDNDGLELGGVHFLGATLWTDFTFEVSDGFNQLDAMRWVEDGINDFHEIVTDYGMLRAQQTLDDHMLSRRWLTRELEKPFGGPTVVVTHHGCHPQSAHPRFAGNRINSGFISDMSPLLQHVDLWVHGHVHDGFDYRVGRCRVVANPAGYARNRNGMRHASDLRVPALVYELENQRFDAELIVNLEAQPETETR